MFYYKYVTGRRPWLQNFQRVIYLLNLATQIKGSKSSKDLLPPTIYEHSYTYVNTHTHKHTHTHTYTHTHINTTHAHN